MFRSYQPIFSDSSGEQLGVQGMKHHGGGGQDRQFVTSLARGLAVLAAYGAGDGALSNRALAMRTGLPRPTAARLTHTLARLGYLALDAGHGGYRLAPRALELGQPAGAAIGLDAVIRPAMAALAELGDVSVALGAPSDLSIRYIALERRPEAIVLNLDVGARLPVPPTAIGRAWLASLSADVRAAEMAKLSVAMPDLWRDHHAHIDREIDRVREEGVATSFGDWRPELNAIACPIRFAGAVGHMMMSVAGLSSVFTRDVALRRFAPAMLGAARGIESRLARMHGT